MFRVLCIASKNLANLTWQTIICAILPWSGQESVSIIKLEANEIEDTPGASQLGGHYKHVVNFFVNRHEQTFASCCNIFVNRRVVMLLLAAYGCLMAVLNVKKILINIG